MECLSSLEIELFLEEFPVQLERAYIYVLQLVYTGAAAILTTRTWCVQERLWCAGTTRFKYQSLKGKENDGPVASRLYSVSPTIGRDISRRMMSASSS